MASATVTMASSRASFGHVGVDEKGLGDGGGIGEAGGLDQNGVELALAAHQAFDDADEVAAHGAADAAVVHFENFFVGVHDEIVVDADFAEFIDDHRKFLAMMLGEDAVEQSGLARAEIAGENGDGDILSDMRCRSPVLALRAPSCLRLYYVPAADVRGYWARQTFPLDKQGSGRLYPRDHQREQICPKRAIPIGALLNEGDNVTVIKDLKVKGSSTVLKRGTVIRGIHLTDDPEEIEGRTDKVKGLVLKTCFLKKS